MPWAVRKGAGSCGATSWAVINATTGRVAGCHPSKAAANKQLAALNANVTEGLMPTATRLRVAETRPLAEAATPAEGTGRLLIQIITPGWGSSGYYSPEVLESAATDRIFPSGLHLYIDHPTATENAERPERSVRDLAAVFTEDARWTGQALVAEVEVLSAWRTPLAELIDAIGMSIRASAEVSTGEAEGRRGTIISELVEGLSVDFVTHAGRGGRILEVLESARPADVVERAVARGITEATAEQRREQLSDALRDAYAGERSYVWVRDFDESTVWFEREGPDINGTFAQAYTPDDGDLTVSLSGDASEVVAQTTYIAVPTAAASEGGTTDEAAGTAEPAAEADPSHPTEETNMPENTGAAGSASLSPRQVIENQLIETRRQVAQMAARDRARDIITEDMADAWLPPTTVARLSVELLEALPMVNDQLDEAALRDRVTAVRDRHETEHAESLQAAGVGAPRGLGYSAGPVAESADKYEERLTESFKRLGLPDEAAKIAAKGR